MSTKIELTSKKNADLTQWEWLKGSKRRWEKAEPPVQEFYNKWRSSSGSALSQEINIGRIPQFRNAPKQFIVRDSYKTMFDHIWERAFQQPDTGVVLTGQPGVGKTYFLWYALIRFIKQGQPVALFTGDTLFLFYGNHVRSPKKTTPIYFPIPKEATDTTEHKPILFVLIDHDTSTSEPTPDLVYGEDIFPIQASPPNPQQFRRWAKRRNAGIWGLPLWNEAELNIAFRLQPKYPKFKTELEGGLTSSTGSSSTNPGVLEAKETLEKWVDKKNRFLQDLEKDDSSTKTAEIGSEEDEIYEVDMTSIDGAIEVLIHAAVRDSGPVARDVFESIFYPTGVATNRASAIASVTYEHLAELSRSFSADQTFPNQTISHRIIMVDPVTHSAPIPAYHRLHDEWKIDYRSVQIAREMSQKLEKEKDDRLAYFFDLFRSSGQSSTLASWILESIAHRTLRTDARQNLALVPMQGDLTVDAPVLTVNFEEDKSSNERLPAGNRRQISFRGPGFANPTTNKYYVPERLNSPLFDSFLVDRQENKLVLWVFQMTISCLHHGSREGYQSIRRIIESLKNPAGHDGDEKVKMEIWIC
ncbi:hypothetical protein Clacol_001281 [Clathrus columnatus]|uniref:Uncharacterized protein n=1 Tax=Clathrus columnatus TaxID=1419009 RepID=A0AAV4ZXZ8_9AGAM|nr:hypothetical protein Clacol_001281 [Clathrus columnatus]